LPRKKRARLTWSVGWDNPIGDNRERWHVKGKPLPNPSGYPSQRKVKKFRACLLEWFERYGRKFPWRNSSTSKYQFIMAEILLQRTRAETVAKFFPTFTRELSSWKKLDQVTIGELENLLQPIGLWRRRASSIKSLAREMANRNGRFPSDRSEIESLPGIGQYIANAILLFCHGEPQPLLDGNMARVLERVFGPRTMADIRYDPYLQKLALDIVQCITPKEVNWAILDLAAKICIAKKPSCYKCPLSDICRYCKKMKLLTYQQMPSHDNS
jgi:A/G-specific adenine glycosylase